MPTSETRKVETRRILLVEDEKTIRDAVAAYLEREGYWVTPAADGRAALDAFATHRFDLVILDLMLPKVSGEVVCREIRNHSDVPLIMLTAKGELDDRIMGLEMGADDYLIKPFSPRELIARVRALLRRVHTGDEPQRDKLVYGDLELDVTAHQALLAGKDLDLTASEFKLLTTLARYPGRVYSRMELVEKVLGYDFEGYERTVDSHVKNLRAKLGDDPRNPRFIYTVHGVGYRFEPQEGSVPEDGPAEDEPLIAAEPEEALAEASEKKRGAK
ncbi:MAG: response regulator transcription factor [Coriobacteriia bacterium]|nr:response regulator transcription factor [Coriobacteriia bacterium]